MTIIGHLMVLNLPMMSLMRSILNGIRQSTVRIRRIWVSTTVAKFQKHILPVVRIFSGCMMWHCWKKSHVTIKGNCGSMKVPRKRPIPSWRIGRIDTMLNIGMGIQWKGRGGIE